MMECGRKTLIVFTLCALVGANEAQQLYTILDIVISIPSTHIGDTEIVSTNRNATAAHPFRYIIVAQKNQTQCINSTDPHCLSMIQPPALDVSVFLSASNGKNVTYSACINGSLELAIHIGPEVSVRPQMVSSGSEAITVLLDITYNKENTTRHFFSPIRRHHTGIGFGVGVIFGTRNTVVVDDGRYRRYWNGEPTLRSAPLCILILLALLPVLLLK